MPKLLRPLLILAILLAIPIVPFLLWGAEVERWVERWAQASHSPGSTAAIIIVLLASDLLLPIPSSQLSTVGGWRLGALGGTLASWTGMMLGAVIGFVLARRWGRPIARRLTDGKTLGQLDQVNQQYAMWLLVVARALPVLAEATVLLAGIHGLAWRKFLPAVALSNFGIALAYAVLGQVAYEQQWLAVALAVSLALPFLLASLARHWLCGRVKSEE